MPENKSVIGGLGEIALRVNDLDRMQAFYAQTVGLELMKRFATAAFFRIADGYAGHTQILALFDRSSMDGYSAPNRSTTSVDHIALTVARDDFDSELMRLESLGLEVSTAEHLWVQWKSLYFEDPEGNTIELVCYDPSIVTD